MESKKSCYVPSVVRWCWDKGASFRLHVLSWTCCFPAPPPAHSTQAHCSTSVHVFVTVFKIQQATEFTLEAAQPQPLSQCDSPSWIRFSVFFQLSNPWGPFYSLHQPPSSLVATDGQGNCHRHVIVGAHIRWDPDASRSYSLWPQILDL